MRRLFLITRSTHRAIGRISEWSILRLTLLAINATESLPMKTSTALIALLVATILLPAMTLLSQAQTIRIKDFAADNLLVDSGTTGENGATSATGWTGKVKIDNKGVISGTIAVRSWANSVNRSTVKNYTVKENASKVYAPAARVLRSKETNSYDWGKEVTTIEWYEADFVLRTTQPGVIAKGRARLEIRQDVNRHNEGFEEPHSSTNTSRYIRLSGGLFGPSKQVGEFYAGN